MDISSHLQPQNLPESLHCQRNLYSQKDSAFVHKAYFHFQTNNQIHLLLASKHPCLVYWELSNDQFYAYEDLSPTNSINRYS